MATPITINGLPVIKATIQEQLFGPWLADVEADTVDNITGAVVLDVEGVSFAATVKRGNVEAGRWLGRIVAGADGWREPVDAKSYLGINVRGAIDDLLRESGEVLDVDGSSATTLATPLPRWQRLSGTVGHAIAELTEALGSSARMTREGLLRIAIEQATEDHEPDGLIVIDRLPDKGIAILAPQQPTFEPGLLFEGQRISAVTTTVGTSELRQEVWLNG